MRFDSATAVIDATGDDTLRERGAGKRQWVLWPVLAWKVLVPESRPRTFDMFQTAILRLCHAGLVRPADIADRLALDSDLVAFIVQQLRDIQLLDEHGRPSERALKLLSRDEEPVSIDTAGHVFEDALTRRLWPRFVTGALPYAEVEPAEHGHDRLFLRGAPGRPGATARMIPPPPIGAAARPPAQAILRAARLHRRQLSSLQLQRGRFGDAARVAHVGRAVPDIRRVRVVDDQPQPIFVATCLFVPREEPSARFHVADPFGLGLNADLHAEALRLANAGRRGPLTHAIEDLVGEVLDVAGEELTELLRRTTADATHRTRAQLGSATGELPEAVIDRLAAAEERLALARARLGGTNRDRGEGQRHLDDFFGFAYAAVEEAFGSLVGRFDSRAATAVLGVDVWANQRLLCSFATRIGFASDCDPDGLLVASAGQVDAAVNGRNRALPGRVAAALLVAGERPEHPLWRLARAFPDALGTLGRLKRLRNRGAHAAEAENDLRAADEALADTYRVMRGLVGSTATETAPVDVGDGRTVQWTAELMMRLRGQAARLVERAVPDAIEIPDMRVRLVDAQHKARELELLAAGSAEPGLIASRLRDFALAAGIVVEAGLAALLRAAGDAQPFEIERDRKRFREALTEAARRCGFALERGELPGDLAGVRLDAVERVLAGSEETQNAMMAALLLVGSRDRDHPMRRVAALRPSFVGDCALVARARGHGDKAGIRVDEVETTMALVYELARTVTATY